MKLSRVIFSLSSLLLLTSTIPLLLGKPLPSQAQSQTFTPSESASPNSPTYSPNRLVSDTTLQFNPPPLPNRGRPTGRRRGGASRDGSCDITGQLPLTAIVPTYSSEAETATEAPSSNIPGNTLVENVFSLTTQPRPSFWFYVPYSLETTPLTFILQDENNNTLYQGTVSNTTAASSPSFGNADGGIIQVTLPESAPALEADMLYHWFLVAYCDETNPSFVEGWIAQQPTEAALNASLAGATPEQQARLYAQNGLWQDSITAIGEQYRQQPANATLHNDWNSLLSSTGLAELSEQPLSDCCALP